MKPLPCRCRRGQSPGKIPRGTQKQTQHLFSPFFPALYHSVIAGNDESEAPVFPYNREPVATLRNGQCSGKAPFRTRGTGWSFFAMKRTGTFRDDQPYCFLPCKNELQTINGHISRKDPGLLSRDRIATAFESGHIEQQVRTPTTRPPPVKTRRTLPGLGTKPFSRLSGTGKGRAALIPGFPGCPPNACRI